MKYFVKEIQYLINEALVSYIDKNDASVYGELRKTGFVIIPDFIKPTECEILLNCMEEHMQKSYAWHDPEGSDSRVSEIETVSAEFRDVFDKPWLANIYKKYISQFSCHHFIMANKVSYTDKNRGSGGGWHRDTVTRRQLKFLMYLNDVDENTGCFQYIPATHTPFEKWKTNRLMNVGLDASRYKDENIEKLLASNNYRVKNITGKAGTLIIVDSSGIHRGRPIKEGNIRYAATQYMSEDKFRSIVKEALGVVKLENNQ
ncbi:hypothetical protein GO495_15955 [Chitinophaga oryziterrae]|uniref:Phytanoyl-CoA dioxygenase n=1 Tax=Chitinophaga oryziterrae TaxID=1031224 RepID=A0A6N8JCL2_9BACT|nr:phytanoyl-CoA dioxygenase family protein [Chitinophaga oryziterrae]MVT42086.1 hypothetical protein [Chitinophaga oryziterrae]